MNITLVSYASGGFYGPQRRLTRSAERHGISKIRAFRRDWLVTTQFYKENRTVLDCPRLGGYALWKPFIIQESLKDLGEGDVLVYLDSDLELVASIQPMAELSKKRAPVMTFTSVEHRNSRWTKRDCFHLMGCDSKQFHDSIQVWSGMLVMVNCRSTRDFVEEWLEHCRDFLIISDLPSRIASTELPDFEAHRHDQSVLANLCVKHGLESFRVPSQWGNHYKAPGLRVAGEWLADGRYSDTPLENSPYGTLLKDCNRWFRHAPTFRNRLKHRLSGLLRTWADTLDE